MVYRMNVHEWWVWEGLSLLDDEWWGERNEDGVSRVMWWQITQLTNLGHKTKNIPSKINNTKIRNIKHTWYKWGRKTLMVNVKHHQTNEWPCESQTSCGSAWGIQWYIQALYVNHKKGDDVRDTAIGDGHLPLEERDLVTRGGWVLLGRGRLPCLEINVWDSIPGKEERTSSSEISPLEPDM